MIKRTTIFTKQPSSQRCFWFSSWEGFDFCDRIVEYKDEDYNRLQKNRSAAICNLISSEMKQSVIMPSLKVDITRKDT